MSDTKWTKGPWKVTYEAGDFDESVGVSMESHQRNPMHYTTAHLWHSDCEPDDEETVANAHLIAAAPDLYEALSDLVDSTCGFYPFDGDDHPSVIEANAALAKARGES